MRQLYVPLVLIVIIAMSASAAEGKIGTIPLAQQVAKADFVGIVECETAGAVTAKYKVIESCRGAKAGEHICIRTFVRFVGPQFRISLCGQRFLAIAVNPGTPTGPRTNALPIGWRELSADYEIGYGQGPSLLSDDMQKRYAEAKKLVEAAKKDESPRVKHAKEAVWPTPGEKPDKTQLDAWRKMVATKSVKSDQLEKARRSLIQHDPAPMVEELVKWQAPIEGKISNIEQIYGKASEIAWLCGHDREKHLMRLVNAADPSVRVVGAIYLCFENEKLGMQELQRLTKLADEPGAWAALTLARRGDKDAMPRALQVFKEGTSGRFYTNLRFNTQVLLSNSAQKSGVPQPPRADPMRPWGDQVDFDAITAWWAKHADKITLHDPWLAPLSKQKID